MWCTHDVMCLSCAGLVMWCTRDVMCMSCAGLVMCDAQVIWCTGDVMYWWCVSGFIVDSDGTPLPLDRGTNWGMKWTQNGTSLKACGLQTLLKNSMMFTLPYLGDNLKWFECLTLLRVYLGQVLLSMLCVLSATSLAQLTKFMVPTRVTRFPGQTCGFRIMEIITEFRKSPHSDVWCKFTSNLADWFRVSPSVERVGVGCPATDLVCHPFIPLSNYPPTLFATILSHP